MLHSGVRSAGPGASRYVALGYHSYHTQTRYGLGVQGKLVEFKVWDNRKKRYKGGVKHAVGGRCGRPYKGLYKSLRLFESLETILLTERAKSHSEHLEGF